MSGLADRDRLHPARTRDHRRDHSCLLRRGLGEAAMKHWWLLPPKEYEEEHIDRLLKEIHRKREPWMLRHEQLVVTSLSMVLVFGFAYCRGPGPHGSRPPLSAGRLRRCPTGP